MHVSAYLIIWIAGVGLATAGAFPVALLLVATLPLVVMHKRVGCFWTRLQEMQHEYYDRGDKR